MNDDSNIDECSVCYNTYNTDSFKIHCNHLLCRTCYNSIVNKNCPICRARMKVPKRYNGHTKGKINLVKYHKIKKHLQYKYSLEGRRYNKKLDHKHMYLRFGYAMKQNIVLV